jgi:phosphosulfolactate phosphohydrolase-like enzyme
VEGMRLILRSPNGTRYSITVNNSGVISATSI